MPNNPTVSAAATHLRLDGVSLSFGSRRVLTDISFTAAGGERLGLIGENGAGKTTLLRIAAGLLTPDAGTVRVTAPGGLGVRVGLLHQESPFAPDVTVAEALESAIAPIRAAEDALEDAAARLAERPRDPRAAHDYAAALEAAERLEVWDVDARIETMLAGLGLADLPRERPTAHLSGGQRSRLALAWLLLSQPDVLLLDEPTNHLDDAATQHLCGVLAAWTGPVVIASHDRAFLDEIVTGVVDLDPSPLPHTVAGPLVGDGAGTGIGVTTFTGTYTEYLLARIEARARWVRQYRDEQAELKRLRVAVRSNQTYGHTNRHIEPEIRSAKRFYADRVATVVSRRVNDARVRLAELEKNQIRKPPPQLRFRGFGEAGDGASGAVARGARASRATGPAATVPVTESRATGPATTTPASEARAGRWSGPVIAVSELAVEGRLDPVSFTVSAGEKLLITGPNGAGKSTLLLALAGLLAPTSGTLNIRRELRVGLLTQEADLPDPHGRGPGRTVRQAYEDLVGAQRAASVPLSSLGLIAGRDEERPVSVLSVGQQRRLALAALLADPPDVLLLDEPTNHLSLLLVTELEIAIPHYPGTVIVASHDRWLRAGWQGSHLVLEPGRVG